MPLTYLCRFNNVVALIYVVLCVMLLGPMTFYLFSSFNKIFYNYFKRKS